MANMSYCRFQNTLEDLRDCQDAIEAGEPIENEEEGRARVELIRLCREIAEDYGAEITES